jgi:hypothetical protein
MKSEDTIRIQCPRCGNEHIYALVVKRSIILENMTFNSSYRPAPKSFRRLFSCPSKGEDFEAVIVLLESPQDKIESVKVNGIAMEEDDD